MRLIEKLSDMIEDEIDGAECYVMTALTYKAEEPEMARVMYNLSMQELQHMEELHAIVVSLIDDYRRENGEPPAKMLAIYEYLHERHIKDAANVRSLQTAFRQQ
jgi:hypothetical protein